MSNEGLDVGTWLEALGLGEYRSLFAEQEIDGDVLLEVTEQELERFGLPLGHRKKLHKAIAALTAQRSAAEGASRAVARQLERAEDRTASVWIPAERRELTVMFCDLVGSTALSRRLDPEDLRDIMGIYLDACSELIVKCGGRIAKYLGDGLMAYFGYPHAQEDAVERAARAGLQLVETVRKLQPRPDIALRIRVGIARGLVVVGHLPGDRVTPDASVSGDAPNLAFRLQEVATPDTVILSDSAMRLLGQLFELEDFGFHELKGIASPVHAWRVLSERNVASRFEAVRGARPRAMLGRDAEVALLLERWELARAGEGQVVLLSGPPGIGKSRIACALDSRVDDEPHAVLRFQCSPFHTNAALHPITVYLEHAAGLAPGQPPEIRLERLERMLAQAGDEITPLLPLFAALLWIPAPTRYPPLNLTPQELKQQTLDALLAWLLAIAKRTPLLIILEDAQWIDPTTREFVALCIDQVETSAVLLLMTHRPDFKQSWTEHAHVTSLTLNRLGRQQTVALINHTAGGKPLPPEVVDQIVAKADGVPLFIEELTTTVLHGALLHEEPDRSALKGTPPELAVPTTLQDALLARLDRLAPMKEVAQIAAAIGREFSYALLAAVAPFGSAALGNALALLVEGEVIHERHPSTQASYVFKHALVQDAAYNTLLRSQRPELHARIARALTEQFPEIAKAQPEVVARNFAEAGLARSAAEWWEKAGERALLRSANLEATNHLAAALEALATLPETSERDRRELDLRLRLRSPLYATKGYASPQMEANTARALVLDERLGETAKHLSLFGWQCRLNVARATTSVELEGVQRFIDLASKADDIDAVVSGLRTCGYALLLRGELRPALEHFERALSRIDPSHDDAHVAEYNFLPVPMIEAMMSLAVQQLGRPEDALNICRRALNTAKQAGHHPTIAYANVHLLLLQMVAGEAAPVEREGTAFLEFLRRKDIPYWRWHCETWLGWAQAKANPGAIDAGLARMDAAASEGRKFRVNFWAPFYLTRQAALLIEARQYDQALRRLDEAEALMRELEQRYAEAELHRLRAVALSAKGAEPSEIEGAFDRALETGRRQEAKLWELRAATNRAQCWRDAGRRRQARDLLAAVYGGFTQGFDTLDMKQAKALLDTLGEAGAGLPENYGASSLFDREAAIERQ